MKILSAQEIRLLDQYTIINEPILSIDLMERAARSIKRWIQDNLNPEMTYQIFSGTGNNGGDGLALGVLLLQEGYEVQINLVKFSAELSLDCATNEKRIWEFGAEINYIQKKEDLPEIADNAIIIDAIFGSGLTRAIEGIAAETIEYINNSLKPIVAIDLPSGLSSDSINPDGPIIEADIVLTLEFPKLSLLIPENEDFVGNWTVIDIGLSEQGLENAENIYNYLLPTEVNQLLVEAPKFAHKGLNGWGMLIAGSKSMTGASILSAKAALRSGIGKLSIAGPERNYTSVQAAVPEAMYLVQGEVYTTRIPELDACDFVAIGCGIGITKETEKLVLDVLKKTPSPMVIDADALNILSLNKAWIKKIPKYSILTPHLGEFERLVGKAENTFQRLEMLRKFAMDHEIIMVLKGAHTAIAIPNGQIYFNSTGNPGMATAGSGDVLTGILLALLCQGYNPVDSTILGVYLHGLSGDIALDFESTESLIASDIVDNLGKAFKQLRDKNNW